MSDIHRILGVLKDLHALVRDTLVEACERSSLEQLAGIAREEEGDTIYSIDQVGEDLLIEVLEEEAIDHDPLILIMEGLPDGKIMLPRDCDESQARWRIIIDPIDGTRELMYQKRSAWILTGVASNRGESTSLQDIELALQTEIPVIKQHLSDSLWAIRGEGTQLERRNRFTDEHWPIQLQPSRSDSIAHGFAMISRFFPGMREELAAIDEEIVMGALGPVQPGKTHCFEDQYLSTGGQLYELMAGHYRFVADLRPLMEQRLQQRGLALGICCHPYDICTELIARELGIIVTDEHGDALDAPLDVEADVTWAGYANERIRRQIEPLLQDALRRRDLLR